MTPFQTTGKWKAKVVVFLCDFLKKKKNHGTRFKQPKEQWWEFYWVIDMPVRLGQLKTCNKEVDLLCRAQNKVQTNQIYVTVFHIYWVNKQNKPRHIRVLFFLFRTLKTHCTCTLLALFLNCHGIDYIFGKSEVQVSSRDGPLLQISCESSFHFCGCVCLNHFSKSWTDEPAVSSDFSRWPKREFPLYAAKVSQPLQVKSFFILFDSYMTHIVV